MARLHLDVWMDVGKPARHSCTMQQEASVLAERTLTHSYIAQVTAFFSVTPSLY